MTDKIDVPTPPDASALEDDIIKDPRITLHETKTIAGVDGTVSSEKGSIDYSITDEAIQDANAVGIDALKETREAIKAFVVSELDKDEKPSDA